MTVVARRPGDGPDRHAPDTDADPSHPLGDARAPVARSGPGPTAFGHRPGLDGLRGLAVAAVLLFHAGYGWAEGGYLGVSAFFTLSGFLITTLLLAERARTGGVSLGAFWVRRARRLLPAALAGIALGVAYVLTTGDDVAIDRVRGDALAALAYVANWRFVWTDRSYAELFSGDSPLQHLWSLAIEEQFYLVLPVVAVVALRRPHPARTMGLVALAVVAGSVAASLLLGDADAGRRYYGTDVRAAELAIGVALACWRHERLTRAPRLAAAGTRLGVDVAGAVALGVLAGSWALLGQDADLLHPWALLVHATLTSVVIVAAIGDGVVARALAWRPLVALGVISYGVYLYHWPLYLWLDEARTGLDGAALLAVRLAATLVLAVASHRLLESPLRHGRRPPAASPARPLLVAGAALATAATLVVAATAVVSRPPAIDFASASDALDSLAGPSTPTTTTPSPSSPDDPAVGEAPVLPHRPRVAIFGDSTALLLVPGLIAWSSATEALDLVEGYAVTGCGLGRGGERVFADWVDPVEPGCSFSEVWPGVLERGQPDVAIVQIGIWDVVDRRLDGDASVRAIGDPVYDDYLRAELLAANDLLLSRVARVVWSLQPLPVRSTRADDDPVFERLAAWNDLLVELFVDHPDVGLIDADAWLASTTDGRESLRMRPDGTHFSELTSVDAATWIGPALLAAAERADVVGPDDVARVPIPAGAP